MVLEFAEDKLLRSAAETFHTVLPLSIKTDFTCPTQASDALRVVDFLESLLLRKNLSRLVALREVTPEPPERIADVLRSATEDNELALGGVDVQTVLAECGPLAALCQRVGKGEALVRVKVTGAVIFSVKQQRRDVVKALINERDGALGAGLPPVLRQVRGGAEGWEMLHKPTVPRSIFPQTRDLPVDFHPKSHLELHLNIELAEMVVGAAEWSLIVGTPTALLHFLHCGELGVESRGACLPVEIPLRETAKVVQTLRSSALQGRALHGIATRSVAFGFLKCHVAIQGLSYVAALLSFEC